MEPAVSDFLDKAAQRAPDKPEAMSVRKLLEKWSAKRRGYQIVQQIEQDLASRGLTTQPHFNVGWIDSEVTIVLKKDSPTEVPLVTEGRSGESAEDISKSDPLRSEIALQIGSLQSARSGVCCVSPQDRLQYAQSLMIRHDYSQLAVMSGQRDVTGAISWESVAQAHLRDPYAGLRDCVVPVETVGVEDDLLPHIPRISDAGFVLVRAHDKTVSGLVTTTDLSAEFVRLANPFFLIGEIEKRLRRAIDNKYKAEELKMFADPNDTQRAVHAAGDLTIGEHARLLEHSENWERMGWRVDRALFVKTLHEVTDIRNDVMHFSPDPLDAEQEDTLRYFIKWLKLLEP